MNAGLSVSKLTRSSYAPVSPSRPAHTKPVEDGGHNATLSLVSRMKGNLNYDTLGWRVLALNQGFHPGFRIHTFSSLSSGVTDVIMRSQITKPSNFTVKSPARGAKLRQR